MRIQLITSLVLLSLHSCLLHAAEGTLQQRQYANTFGKVSVEALQQSDGQREFKLQAGHKDKTIQIGAEQLQIHTSNALFDALFSLTQHERTLNSVNEITDWGFNEHQPVPCPCFETGAKWHYVWTRDLSYSLDLGFGYLDPERAQHSLRFKTSVVRPELVAAGITQTEVALQDTGSGGSWPVSTDRVVWIMAASQLTATAQPDLSSSAAQQQWLAEWYPIAKQTLLQDRAYAYNPTLGLYRGETSFLDWREQTYPDWTAKHTLYLAQSHALSTNVLHYIALSRTAAAAEQLEPAVALQFRQWADELKTAINQWFWLPEQGLYASYIGESFNPMPVHQYDLLGLALAITHQIASPLQASQILQNYPQTPAGPPVIFPARQHIPIYHNRAIWPFVSAYALRAAKQQQHAQLFHRIAMSMFQGTAFHLSNMENLEWLTLKDHVEDGDLSGPVINSERQLWSVAGYHDFVAQGLFGVDLKARKLRFDPFIPSATQQELQLGQVLRLNPLPVGSAKLDLNLTLAGRAKKDEVYRLHHIKINGVSQALSGAHQFELDLDDLTGELNLIEMELKPVKTTDKPIQLVKVKDPAQLTAKEQRQLFAPKSPLLELNTTPKGDVVLEFNRNGETDTHFTLYKNGEKIAVKKGKDSLTHKANSKSQCYALVQTYQDTGLTSLPTPTLCTTPQRQQFIAGHTLLSQDHAVSQHLGLEVYKNWGEPQQTLELDFVATQDGAQRLDLQYFIDNGPINTGITAVVKNVAAYCGEAPGQYGTLVLPHLATAAELGYSSSFTFQAASQAPCKIQIKDGFNMSYLQHFELYTGGKGGRTGPLNQAVIHAVSVVPAQ